VLKVGLNGGFHAESLVNSVHQITRPNLPDVPCDNHKDMPQPVSPYYERLRPLFLACAIFIGLSCLWLIIALRYSQTAWDFTQFYIAAHLPIGSLYARADFVAVGARLLAPIGIKYYPPFVRPAVFSLALKPLALFSYWIAYWIWAALGLVVYLVSLLILFRWRGVPENILPWFALFYPAMFGIVTGQDANVYLLVFIVALLLIISGKETAGGCVLALCVYKFNLILLIPLVLLAKARWRALVSFSITAGAATIVSAALVSPSKYLALLRTIPELTIGFVPGGFRGVTIRIGHPGWYFAIAAIGTIGCLYLIWKLPLVEALSVGITGALMLSYHATWYDCTLLVFPICVAWATSSHKMQAALLTLLVLPIAWLLGHEFFQVFAELLILVHFAGLAFRSGSQTLHVSADTSSQG